MECAGGVGGSVTSSSLTVMTDASELASSLSSLLVSLSLLSLSLLPSLSLLVSLGSEA